MKYGFFFDVDDTLCATGVTHGEAYKTTLRMLGIDLPFFDYSKFSGMQTDAVFRLLLPNADEEAILNAVRIKRQIFKESVEDIKPMDGAIEILEYLQDLGRKIFAVSSGSASSVNSTLESTKMTNYFDRIITCDSVQKTKPHADPYLYAIQIANLNPIDCIAIEDSETGIQSALAANLDVVLISSSSHDWMAKYTIRRYNSLELLKKTLEVGDKC